MRDAVLCQAYMVENHRRNEASSDSLGYHNNQQDTEQSDHRLLITNDFYLCFDQCFSL